MLAETLGDDENLAYTNLHSARYLQQVGQPLRAQEHAEAALAAFERTGKQHAYAHCVLTLGHLAWARGDYRDAAGRYRESHRFYEGYDDRRGTTHCKLRLAELAFSIKKLKESGTLLRDALDGYRAMGDQVGMAECRVLGGRIELRGKNPQSALAAFLDVAGDMQDRGDVAGVIAVKAQEALAREMLQQTDEVDRLILEIFESVRSMPVAQECFARALDSLARLINGRRPELALELDTLAAEAWQMLGRRITT